MACAELSARAAPNAGRVNKVSKLFFRSVIQNRVLAERFVLKNLLHANGVDIGKYSRRLTYDRAEALMRRRGVEAVLPPREVVEAMVRNTITDRLLLLDHVPGVFAGDVDLFVAGRYDADDNVIAGTGLTWQRSRTNKPAPPTVTAWRPYVSGSVAAQSVDCSHFDMLASAPLRQYGGRLKKALEG